MKFATRLRYKYAQVAVDLYFENSIPIPFEAMLCFSTSSPFVDLKDFSIILKFGSTELCSLARKTSCAKN